MSDFVDRIDNLLQLQNKKRNNLYEAISEINAHSLYDWNRRNTVPSADIAVKIAQYLGTSVEYLITGEEKNIYKEKYDNLMKDVDNLIQKVKNSSD